MAMIVCHSPKGGTGTTFVAAHLAMSLADAGADVTVLTLAARDTLPLHFGLQPALTLPALTAPAEDAVLVAGISLRHHGRAAEDADFVPMLRDLDFFSAGPDRVLVVDCPAGEHRLARRLAPHASAHLYVVNALPDTLALMPQVLGETTPEAIARTSFVINRLDETRRLSRHVAAFIRELTGPRLLGRVRMDEAVPEAIAMLQPLARYAPASAALADVRAIGAAIVPSLESAGRPWIARGERPASPSESRAA